MVVSLVVTKIPTGRHQSGSTRQGLPTLERKMMRPPRKRPPDVGHKFGQFGPGRRAWITFPETEAVYYQSGDTDMEIDSLPPDKLLFMHRGRIGSTLYLSRMTYDEVCKLQEFINMVLDSVKDRCKRLDAKAQEAFDDGDDSFSRIYRPVPEIYVRKQPTGEHGEGVHDGHDDDALGDREYHGGDDDD
jgi:hypothetical protein